MSSKKKISREDYFPPWCDPLPIGQDRFFMAVMYNISAESEKDAVYIIYLSSGKAVHWQMLNAKDKMIEVYVVSLLNPPSGVLSMERVRKMTYGYVCDDQGNPEGMAYGVVTRNGKQYTFCDFGEVPMDRMWEQGVLFMAEWLWFYVL